MAKKKEITVAWDSGLNVRLNPSYSAAVVKVLPFGAPVKPTGEASDGWLPIEGGYVRAEYLK